ncbi:hypothetical protein Tco_1001003 [Tanacetum coccineum]
MSNSNTNLQTQSSNALHNAFREAGSKDVPPMLHRSEEQELEAHNITWQQIHEVTPDPVDNSGPIFDDETMHKCTSNITIESSDICYNRAQDDQDETDNLDQERDLLASLIQKLKCEIDDSKNQNKFLESSNKDY